MAAELYHGDPLMIDYTPASAVTAGDMIGVIVGGARTVWVAHRDIAATELGAVAYPSGTAVYKIPLKTGSGFAIGDPVNVDLATGEADSAGADLFGTSVIVADQTAGDTFVYAVHNT